MRSNNLITACEIVVAGLPKQDKEKLLHDLARECGYLLQPDAVLEDFQRKLFADSEG